MKVYRDVLDATTGVVTKTPIFNIMEGTYSGQDMGERSITATIEFPTPIDFHSGDYVEFDIADLIRGENVEGGHFVEKFYIYTMPTVKKIASSMSAGNAFEHTVTFYPRQYELGCTQMRDLMQETNSGVIYTGYDEFSFYGGAKTLMDRIICVLRERFGEEGTAGVDYWDYVISDSINEERNTACEKFQFDFSGNSVMEAIVKLNDKDGINTKFWINERRIYVGFKRPYICGVDDGNVIRTIPFEFKYGKTSHLPISTNYGNLFSITKTLGSSSPITRLYAYGSDRNLHRFYCSDRMKSGRYINKLMLPSFGDDGKTDYVDSVEGIAKFGIREGSKTFDDIYPSLRYFTYGDLRSVKYCIKIMGSGVESDTDTYEDGNTYTYPVARVQCYKVEELKGTKVNKLVESAPPVDLAVFCHATGKSVKVILYADKDGTSAMARQQAAAGKWGNGHYRVPARSYQGTDYIAGSAFAVHDDGYECGHTHDLYTGVVGNKKQDDSGTALTRDDWFVNIDSINTKSDGDETKTDNAKLKYKNEVEIHQINYTDTHWITDIFEFTSYDQTAFQRQGYSAYCYPRINNKYPNSQSDETEVNAIVDISPVVIEDTDLNVSEGKQQDYVDVFLRDVGFKINEQTWFGDYVFLFDTCKVSFLDGNIAGYELTVCKESETKKLAEVYIPALLEDGTENPTFFEAADYMDETRIRKAYESGAFWRVKMLRAETDIDNYWLPNVNINASAGDHIVFLSIYMPDVYQRVAERRLEKEARKYLDANDDGDIQYTFDFDKVRMLQVPAFGLQIREGAIMRVVDDDLDIKTVNSQKTIFKDMAGLMSRKSLVQTEIEDVDTETKEYLTVEHRGYDYLADMYEGDGLQSDISKHAQRFYSLNGKTYFVLRISADDEYGGATLYFPNNRINVLLVDNYGVEFVQPDEHYYNHYCYLSEERHYIALIVDFCEQISDKEYYISYHIDRDTIDNAYDEDLMVGWAEYDMATKHTDTSSTLNYKSYVLPQGTRFFCPAQRLTEFKANKYYEVTMDCENTTMPYFDVNGNRTLFALVNNLSESATWFVPEYTVEEVKELRDTIMWRTFVFKFTLGEDFNESQDYYPAIQYISDGSTEAVSVRLRSIVESDAGGLTDLNYADLSIDTVTIKFNDNTRQHGVMLQNGVEPSRRVANNVTPMLREITATVKEESRASVWSQVMSRVADNEILGDQIIKTQETLANAARRRYLDLLALKNAIFDPDGTCDQTFLQVMMLQVGADSMNFQLDKTRQAAGTLALSNCRILQTSGADDKFQIFGTDVLRHYVYTQNEPAGTWYVTAPDNSTTAGILSEFDLTQVTEDGSTYSYPTYFVAIKCAIHDSKNATWICEPTQRKVNEDDEYYYFNWGILSPDASGHYALTETRGNAYMYGDNLICGKISTLAGNSYFDLTHGNFVLSNGTSKALSYENGILTIGGINDGSEESVLRRLGLLGDEVATAQSTADSAQSAADAAKSALDNLQIGGRNLLKNSSKYTASSPFTFTGKSTDIIVYDKTLQVHLENGAQYTISAKTDGTWSSKHWTDGTADPTKKLVALWLTNGTNYNFLGFANGNYRTFTCSYATGDWWVRFNGYSDGNTAITVNVWDIKIEKGNKATDWTPAPEDVEASIAENKDYTTGLVNELGDTLQNQIDGVVDSYFMEGTPANNYRPAAEWTTPDLKKRHLGDTYTNILKAQADLSELNADGTPAWIEQGYLLVGTTHYGKTFEEQRTTSMSYCRTKCIFENTGKSTIPATPSSTIQHLVILYDSNRQYCTNYAWSSAAQNVPSVVGGVSIAYISVLYKKTDSTALTPKELAGMSSCVLTNPDAGKSWRWCDMEDTDDTTFHWHEIADSDAVRALQAAANAQDTADGKRRVFVTTPYPPYDEGDLWAPGDTGSGAYNDIFKCKTARASGSYVASDWEAASSALRAAGDAQTAAEEAQKVLDNIAADNIITAQEKVSVRTEWASIQAEFEKNTANAKVCWGDKPEENSLTAKDELWYTSGYAFLTNTEIDNKIVGYKITKVPCVSIMFYDDLTNKFTYYTPDYTSGSYSAAQTFSGVPKEVGGLRVGYCAVKFEGDSGFIYIGVRAKKQQYLHQTDTVEIVKSDDGTYTTTVTITGYYEDPIYKIYLDRYNTLKTYLEETIALNSNTDSAITISTYGSVQVNPFTRAFANYYAANIELQKAIATRVAEIEAQAAVDGMDVGGENLCNKSEISYWYQGGDDYTWNTTGVTLEENKNYIATCGLYEEIVQTEDGDATTVDIPDEFAGSYLAVIAMSSTKERKYVAAFDWGEIINVSRPSGCEGWALNLYVIMGGKDISVEKYPTVTLSGATSKSANITADGNTAQFTLKSGSSYVTPTAFTVEFTDSGNISQNYSKSLTANYYQSVSFSYTHGSSGVKLLRLAFPYNSTTYYAIYNFSSALFTVDKTYRVWIEYYKPTASAGATCTLYIFETNSTTTVEGDEARGLLLEYLMNETPGGFSNANDFCWNVKDSSGNNIEYYKKVSEILVQEGTTPTKYQPYVEHLTSALQGSTEVAGGLLMTNVLMLKNENNKVTAGMSGLSGTKANPENVLLWGGGTYNDAFNAAQSSTYAKQNGTPITTLLKKDGTGKIGIFKISDDSVIVENGGVPTIITSGSIQDFTDANGIGIGYTHFDKTYTSSAMTSHNCTLMSRTFDGTQTGTIKIPALNFGVSYYGTDALRGASARIKITVQYNNKTEVIYDMSKSDTGSGGYNETATTTFTDGTYSNTFAKLQSFKIELLNATTTYGNIGVMFICYAGTAGNKACVIANDGMMLSSGDGNRFVIKPSDDAMSIIADLPIVEKAADVEKLVIGQLFTDSSGIVRRYSDEDEINKDNAGYQREFVSLGALRNGYTPGNTPSAVQKKQEYLILKSFYNM